MQDNIRRYMKRSNCLNQLKSRLAMRMKRLALSCFLKRVRMDNRYPIHDMDVGTQRKYSYITRKDKQQYNFQQSG